MHTSYALLSQRQLFYSLPTIPPMDHKSQHTCMKGDEGGGLWLVFKGPACPVTMDMSLQTSGLGYYK